MILFIIVNVSFVFCLCKTYLYCLNPCVIISTLRVFEFKLGVFKRKSNPAG